jgi:hypothetical protein
MFVNAGVMCFEGWRCLCGFHTSTLAPHSGLSCKGSFYTHPIGRIIHLPSNVSLILVAVTVSSLASGLC